jgi:hypothetical protein
MMRTAGSETRNGTLRRNSLRTQPTKEDARSYFHAQRAGQEEETTMTFTTPRSTKKIMGVLLLCALWVCLATTKCFAMEYWSGIDEHPRQISPGKWRFSITVPFMPVGLQFVGAQYDFAGMTNGIDVRGPGWYFADNRQFYAIAPTLFDPIDGFIAGWNITDLNNGTFSGVVYATAPLTTVHFTIVADGLVPVRGQ